MDLNAVQNHKIFSQKCLEHKMPFICIYLKDDTNSPLACQKCFIKKKLDHEFILEIDDFLNNNEIESLKKLVPVLSKQFQSYLDSENMKSSNKDELIEKVSKQFDEFADIMLSNIDKLKKQVINHIISTEEQRSNIIKIMNQTSFIEDLKAKIEQFSDDPIKLNDQLKQIISTKNTCLKDDKKKIEDSLKDHMNQVKQIDLKHIENSLESILQKVTSTNILLQNHNNPESNSISIQIPQQSLIKEPLQIESIEELKSIPNVLFYQNIEIHLANQDIEDEELQEVCDELKQCKYIEQIYLDLDDNQISDKGIEYLCKLISELKYLTEFKLFLTNNNDITKLGVSKLTKALSFYSAQIQCFVLNLNHNKNISDSVVLTYFIPLFRSFSNLCELCFQLQETKISGNTVKEIANILKILPKLKKLYLNLSDNRIDDESIIYLSNEGIKSLNSQIQQLYLWLGINNLENLSAISLMNTISTCHHLKELTLDLSKNNIGEDCIKQLEQFKLKLKDQHCKNLISIKIAYDKQK